MPLTSVHCAARCLLRTLRIMVLSQDGSLSSTVTSGHLSVCHEPAPPSSGRTVAKRKDRDGELFVYNSCLFVDE